MEKNLLLVLHRQQIYVNQNVNDPQRDNIKTAGRLGIFIQSLVRVVMRKCFHKMIYEHISAQFRDQPTPTMLGQFRRICENCPWEVRVSDS